MDPTAPQHVSFGDPIAYKWNASQIPLDDIKIDSNLAWLLFSLVIMISWVIYITFYNSRVLGFLLTKFLNHFYVEEGFLQIAGISLNALSGKIMFRDIVYVTTDNTLRIQDGYLIFRWWKSYVPKDVGEDLSHSDTRVSIVLNGLEFHVYNRSKLYNQLVKTFNLNMSMFPPEDDDNDLTPESLAADKKQTKWKENFFIDGKRPEAVMARTWRDLIPVIKMEIFCGKFVFGNRLTPTSLSIIVEESHFLYSTKPAASTLDRFMHFCKGSGENLRVMLVPSPKYIGLIDEPPRYMGEGFVLMSTNFIDMYMYMDEPGLVPNEPVLLTLANGDVVEAEPPIWGLDIKCGKGTDFSYGPWADRQRDHLYKIFYPQDYQPMEVTKVPKPGEKRQIQVFDIRISTLSEATIDLLFSKNKETNAVHVNIGAGSFLEISIPWTVYETGYTTKIRGQLLHLEATTSLQFRDLISSESLEIVVDCNYPLIWNEQQHWDWSITGCKATLYLVFQHKYFFQDFIEDWIYVAHYKPSILHFLPYVWKFNVTLKQCEIITLCNDFNLVDCSSIGQKQKLENNQLGLCAYLLHMSFALPFDQFLPETIPFNFSIQGESIDLAFFVPETCSIRTILLALNKYIQINSKDNQFRQKTKNVPKWRNICTRESNWFDFWWIPIGAISINFIYHPISPLGPEPQADISTPVKEELLLSPIRFPRPNKMAKSLPNFNDSVEPSSLAPDRVKLDLEIGPSILLVYGIILKLFINLKENIFGEDQILVEMKQEMTSNEDKFSVYNPQNVSTKLLIHEKYRSQNATSSNLPENRNDNVSIFDVRNYRPLSVDVSVILHDIQAHLLVGCNSSENSPHKANEICPVILIERFGFEMKKRYEETKLQLLLSPCVMYLNDNISRKGADAALGHGRLTLSALQIRGHAMFSDKDIVWGDDTVEYGWLVEIQLGKLSGKVTVAHLEQIIATLNVLILLFDNSENQLSKNSDGSQLPVANETEKKPKPPFPINVKMFSSTNTNTSNINMASTFSKKPKMLSHRKSIQEQMKKFKGQDKNTRKLQQQNHQQPQHLNAASKCHKVNIDSDGLNNSNDKGKLKKITDQHALKYKLFRLSVDAVDLWLVENGVAVQAFVSPVRVACCNLHGKDVDLGVSCLIQNIRIQQVMRTTMKNFLNGNGYQNEMVENWLKIGAINFDSLILESSTGTEVDEITKLQSKFLRFHDEKTRRLWFLWSNENPGCGCVGGCTFFGNNFNGVRFFKPHKSDLKDGVNIAVIKNATGGDYGFGQSILYENHKVFRTPPYNVRNLILQENPETKTYSERSASVTREAEVPYIKLTTQRNRSKLDSESKLNVKRSDFSGRKTVSDCLTKNSLSDSKLVTDFRSKSDNNPRSLSSENQSEVYFTALDDCSSSKTVFKSPNTDVSLQSKYYSDIYLSSNNDHTDEFVNDSSTENTLTNSSDNPSSPLSSTFQNGNRYSFSNVSYQSALGSQEENRSISFNGHTILDNSVLMSAYTTHLTQALCLNWSKPVHLNDVNSLFHLNSETSTLQYTGGNFVPHFIRSVPGFTSLKMTSNFEKIDTDDKDNKIKDNSKMETDSDKESSVKDDSKNETVRNTSIMIKITESIDVMITPLILESTQKFLDTLIPVFNNIHPFTVLNFLHNSCINQIIDANVLKKHFDTTSWPQVIEKQKLGTIYEEYFKSKMQISVDLKTINVTMLQVALDEEVPTPTTLSENQTCTSLFAVCFRDFKVDFHHEKQVRELIQTYYRPVMNNTSSKKGSVKGPMSIFAYFHNITAVNDVQVEPVCVETAEKLREDTVLSLYIGKIHSQLRRLQNDSSVLSRAIITAIPAHKSKVAFNYEQSSVSFYAREYYESRDPKFITEEQSNFTNDGNFGFIMFECGLEGISVKIVKRDEFLEPSNNSAHMADGTESSNDGNEKPKNASSSGNMSSSIFNLNDVWFNFAAPPQTLATTKIGYTRFDWNFLSTASPAINAWMNPSNKFAMRLVYVSRQMYKRSSAVVACLMTQMLEMKPFQLPCNKSRFEQYLTPLAKTLQEDSSCHLFRLLEQFILNADLKEIERNLLISNVPPLSTLRQGIIALSRQWKNILYTPLITDRNQKYKSLKPVNVMFTVPEVDDDVTQQQQLQQQSVPDNIEDEHTTLLYGQSKPPSSSIFQRKFTHPSSENKQQLYSNLVYPLLSSFSQYRNNDDVVGYGALHEEKNAAAPSNAKEHTKSNSDLGSSKAKGTRSSVSCDDLYNWVAKQQKESKKNFDVKFEDNEPKLGSKIQRQEFKRNSIEAVSLFPMQDSLHLLDVHVVFKPLLLSLNIIPHQLITSKMTFGESKTETNKKLTLDSFGANLSLTGSLDSIKIDIVISDEYYNSETESIIGDKKKTDNNTDANNIQDQLPAAFTCQNVRVDLDLTKLVDMTVSDIIRSRHVLYISNSQIKKHSSLALNFSVSVKQISQQVNMPLLRLLKQINNMYENVKEKQNELFRESHSLKTNPIVKTSSTSSEIVHLRQDPTLSRAHLRNRNLLAGYHSLIENTSYNPNSLTEETPSEVKKDGDDRSQCWKTIYHLLDLYATMPETKRITHRFSFSDFPDLSKKYASKDKNTHSINDEERIKLVALGVFKIESCRFLAYISGLRLETETKQVNLSVNYRKKNHLPSSSEWSLTGHMGEAKMVLLEGVAPINLQTVVQISIGKSQALYSYFNQKSKDNNNIFFLIGEVMVSIPQHPVALHGMVTRGTKHLSSTIQELRFDRFGKYSSTSNTIFVEDVQCPKVQQQQQPKLAPDCRQQTTTKGPETSFLSKIETILNPLAIKCSVILKSFRVSAALLPSLQAEYKMEKVHSMSITGKHATLRVDLPKHSLSFTTITAKKDANLPSEANINLPAIQVFAEYIREKSKNNRTVPNENLLFYHGNYVSGQVDIGAFKHCLTTDLLNHLVFIQKVFMSEVNEVIQKVYGGERLVPLWSDEDCARSGHEQNQQLSLRKLLYSITIRMQRIQITATTAANSAIRLETGILTFELTNRVCHLVTKSLLSKLFGKATVDLNLFLGQLIRTSHLNEIEADFQEFAFFKTNICIRNAIQDGDSNTVDSDKEKILITLKEPRIYIQPIAVDKAILIWLNYKNAYEYWMEKRSDLQGNITSHIFDKSPFTTVSNSNTIFLQLTVTDMGICIPLNSPLPLNSKSIFDLETKDAVVITLENTNISACSSDSLVSNGKFTNLCLRFAEDFQASLDDWKPKMADLSLMNLCVVSDGTYEICSMTIPSKSSNENAKWLLNVQWQMEGVDMEFDTNVGRQLSALGHTLTMLATNESSPYDVDDNFLMNFDYVFNNDDQKSHSDEKKSSSSSDDSKWMKNNDNDNDDDDSSDSPTGRKQLTNLPDFIFDQNIDPKVRTKLLETEMSEQAKLINDLRMLGASHNTIQQELKKFRELESLVYKDFRRDMMQKLRRQSIKADSVRTKQKTTLDSLSPKSTTSSRTMSFKQSNKNLTNRNRQMSLPTNEHSERTIDWLNEFENNDGEDLEPDDNIDTTKEPCIDFQLDVKVLINCGKCVLHTKDDEGKEKSKKNETAPEISPVLSRRLNKDKLSQTMSSSRLRTLSQAAQNTDVTIFHIPGMEVKLHYDSKVVEEEDHIEPTSNPIFSFDTIHEENSDYKVNSKKGGVKKASLFVWMTLESFPEEAVLTPHILEFLEQTLEPIPIKDHLNLSENSVLLEEFGSNMNIYSNYAYESFPVDVIVYFHMQSSSIRFSCLPVSRVECILQLPSLDIVFSSKRADEELLVKNDDNTSSIGGLSVTACLSDFSVYIFHPYGGKKKSGYKESELSPSNTNERKDSLSINVEFVKLNLSRLKKINVIDNQKAGIEFSAVCDIGSASFKYDMRRLTEILAFPKAWYKRSIVRRLFLGDLSSYSSNNVEFLNTQQQYHIHTKLKSNMAHTDRHFKSNKGLLNIPKLETCKPSDSWETVILFAINFNKLHVHMNMGNVMGNTIWQTNDLRSEGRLSIGANNRRDLYITLGISKTSLDAKSGIVGGTIEVSNVNTYIKIKEESNQRPEHELGLKLFATEIRLDYMATSVLMVRISQLLLTLKDEWKLSEFGNQHEFLVPGTHRLANIFINSQLNWDQFQLLISKSSSVDILKMYSKLEEFFNQQFNSSKRVFTSLRTDSTTVAPRFPKPDHSTVIQIEDDNDNANVTSNLNDVLEEVSAIDQHWQSVLNSLDKFKVHLSSAYLLPQFNTILGGVIELKGSNISIACFHGINFKSKSWALFSVKDPSIIFVTEAQELPMNKDQNQDENSVHVVQTVTCNLGISYDKQVQQQSMATICKVSRNVVFPPQFKNIHEWFIYAFSTSPIDEIERFPSFELERLDKSRIATVKQLQQSFSFNREVIFALPSLQLDFKTEHFQSRFTTAGCPSNVECSFVTQFDDHIFVTVDAEAFFFLHDLITSYIREKNKVTSFKIETNYAENSSETSGSSVSGTASAIGAEINTADVVKVDQSAQQKIFSRDNRNFTCKTWHLEPTVRLLSWGGKSIEPYGIDYILQKLGFTHARITIPKWMQRGLMDPLDKSLALLTLQMLAIIKSNSQKKSTN